MELISAHICKGQDIGVHGTLFGGVMLSWLDEAGGVFASNLCETPRMVTLKLSEVVFKKPVRAGHLIKIYGELDYMRRSSIAIRLKARRHSVHSGTQRTVCRTNITYVCVDSDGEAIPISEHIRTKYNRGQLR